MRSFVASLTLFVAGILGTIALAGHILSNTVLEPDSPGQVIDAALEDPQHRKQLIERLTGITGKKSEATRQISKALEDPDVRERIRELRLDRGAVDITALRNQVGAELKERGEARAAAQVRRGQPRIELPGDYAEKFDKLATMASFAATAGTIAAVALVALAIGLSTDRPSTVTSAGLSALGIVGLALVLFLVLPLLLAELSDSGWVAMGAEILKDTGDGIVMPLVVMAAIGATFVAAGLLWPKFVRD
jgi:hypothetical protein